MSLRKEILILFFVLAGCLIIVFTNPSQSVNQLSNRVQPAEEPNQGEIPVPSQNLGIFQQNQESSRPFVNHFFTKTDSIVEENNNLETIASMPEENIESWSQASLSLEDILAKVKNLSSDLNLEFEEYQSKICSTCHQDLEENDTLDDGLKEYLSSKGYSSWEAYSTSTDYRLVEEDFLSNKNNLLRESPSTYPTIYAQAGLGCGCWDPACYTVTPWGIYWHCLGPCCCATCFICAR